MSTKESAIGSWYASIMVALSLVWDQAMLAPLRSRGLERALTRALSKAGGDAIRAVRVTSSRTVRSRKRMKASRVNKALELQFPRGSKHIDDLVWRMKISPDLVPTSQYPYRQTRLGVSVAINKGKRTLIKGAFVATMKSGHVGIFMREGKARLPIKEAFSSRVNDVMQDKATIPAVSARGQAVFQSSFARLLPLEIAKGR